MSTRRLAVIALSLAAVTSTACYHAVIDTGRPATGQVINQPWAMSFVYGLIPPPEVNTASTCPGGVAKVETQHSFLNGLVAMLTFGLVTPIQITVTCAGGSASTAGAAPTVQVAEGATADQQTDAIGEAARLAVEGDGTAFVRF